MLSDILIAIVVAAAFGAGSLLYHLTKEEIDSFKKRFSRYKNLPKAKDAALVPVGIFGVFQAVATTTRHLETISLLFVAMALIFGSFVVAESSKKLTLKYTAETLITFLLFFLTVYFMIFIMAK